MTGVKVRIKRGLYKDCTGLVTNVFKSIQTENSAAVEPADALVLLDNHHAVLRLRTSWLEILEEDKDVIRDS